MKFGFFLAKFVDFAICSDLGNGSHVNGKSLPCVGFLSVTGLFLYLPFLRAPTWQLSHVKIVQYKILYNNLKLLCCTTFTMLVPRYNSRQLSKKFRIYSILVCKVYIVLAEIAPYH